MSSNPYQIIFLLGVMRSGTTYLRNIIASNPNVLTFYGELNEFWTRYGGAPCGTTPKCPQMSSSDLNPEVKSYVHNYFLEFYNDRNRLIRLLHRAYRKARYTNETIVKKGQPFYIVNKSTHLVNKIPYIDAIFPEARYIFIIRDIFSQANSLKLHLERMLKTGKWLVNYPKDKGDCWSFQQTVNKKKPTGSSKIDFNDIPRYWLDQNMMALRALSNLGRSRTLHVNYTDLVEDPKTTILKLEHFLGIKWFQKNISQKLVNNLSSDPLHEWRVRLLPDEISSIQSIINTHKDDYQHIWSFF